MPLYRGVALEALDDDDDGLRPAQVDVRAIRAGLGLSQPQFACRFGFTSPSARFESANMAAGSRRPRHGCCCW